MINYIGVNCLATGPETLVQSRQQHKQRLKSTKVKVSRTHTARTLRNSNTAVLEKR